MPEPVELRTDGPHSPAYTRQLGDALAEVTRVLNYATTGSAGGLEYPADVYGLLGALSAAASRLPQLLGQLAAWLQDHNAAGKISVDQGSATEAVVKASEHLMAAEAAVGRLQYALGQAHQITAGMSGKEARDEV
jgi:hypothetical protein